MNLSLLLRSAAFTAFFTTALSAHADIDQNQPSAYNFGLGTIAGFESPTLAQSFKQVHGNITGAGFLLSADPNRPASSTITISLYDALPNAGGTLLAAGTSALSNRGTWADVSFGGIVPVTAEQTYYLVLASRDVQPAGIAGDGDVYSRGMVYTGMGYEPYPSYDFAFRTTYAPVPEPATPAALGLGAVGLIRRRRAGW